MYSKMQYSHYTLINMIICFKYAPCIFSFHTIVQYDVLEKFNGLELVLNLLLYCAYIKILKSFH